MGMVYKLHAEYKMNKSYETKERELDHSLLNQIGKTSIEVKREK